MKFSVIKFGRAATQEARLLVDRYAKRLKTFCPTQIHELKNESSFNPAKKDTGDYWVTLEERGELLSTSELVGKVKTWASDPAIKNVTFFIGGPYGLPPEVVAKRNMSWSLSKSTFPSDLAWILVTEQLYRAYTVIKGMDYHHE